MSNKVLLKKSSVSNRVPTTSDLDYGELAINYADGKLYFKTSSNQINYFSTSSALDLSAVGESIIPATNETYDLGTSTYRWRDLYLSGNTINLGDATISADGEQIVLPPTSQMTVNSGETKQLALVSENGSVIRAVPLYTQTSGLASVAKYLSFSNNPDSYVFTSFTFSDGSSITNTTTTLFYF